MKKEKSYWGEIFSQNYVKVSVTYGVGYKFQSFSPVYGCFCWRVTSVGEENINIVYYDEDKYIISVYELDHITPYPKLCEVGYNLFKILLCREINHPFNFNSTWVPFYSQL